jgi:hypothetical protein
MTSDGSFYQDENSRCSCQKDYDHVVHSSARVQPYAECAAAAMAAAAAAATKSASQDSGEWFPVPFLQVSALITEPVPFEVITKTLTGEAEAFMVHEGTTIEQLKEMAHNRRSE